MLKLNRLSTIPNGLFQNPELIVLDLSNNQIQTIADKAFQNFRNMTTINLQGNKIKLFPQTMFDKSFISKSVDLSNNPLSCECFIVSLELQTMRLLGKLNGKCNTPVVFQGRQITSLTRKELKCTTCDFNECRNNASCAIKQDYYICECVSSYEGKFCEKLIEIKSKSKEWIILVVCLAIALLAGAAGLWVYYRRRKGQSICLCSKTQLCCFCFLFILVVVMVLFFTLRIISYQYEHS